MTQLWNQMIRWPVAVTVVGLDLMARMLRGLEEAAGMGLQPAAGGGGVGGDVAAAARDLLGRGSAALAGGVGRAANELSTTLQEAGQMSDQDLSGDDLKYVRYAILFTKRDLEATLEPDREEVLNYSTDPASFGGRMIARFMRRVYSPEGMPRPQVWIESGYPPETSGDRYHDIPEDDQRYISIVFEVERRMPRQAGNYDKQKVDALREIARKL